MAGLEISILVAQHCLVHGRTHLKRVELRAFLAIHDEGHTTECLRGHKPMTGVTLKVGVGACADSQVQNACHATVVLPHAEALSTWQLKQFVCLPDF